MPSRDAPSSNPLIRSHHETGGRSTAQAAREHADIAALLLDAPPLARIPAGNIDRVSERVERIEVSAGETVLREGEAGEHYFLIESGRCEVRRHAGDGGEPVQLAVLGNGEGFGEEALLSSGARNASVIMLAPGVVLRLDGASFLDLVAGPLLARVDHERAEDLVAVGARWVDVRSIADYHRDALEGAISLPLAQLREQFVDLAADGSFIVYCDSGRRSRAAAFLLCQRGIRACFLDGGISSRRPRARLARMPTEVLPRVREELARSEQALEHAIRNVATAQAQQAAHSQRMADSGQRERVDARLESANEEVNRAQAALQPVKALRLALEQKVRDAEARAASRRRHAQMQCDRMRQETQAQLEQQKQRLAQQYREASDRLRRIEEARLTAQARLDEERQRLQAEFDAALARMDQEANHIRSVMEAARRDAESTAEILRKQHMAREEALRNETETALAEERRRLEEEVERSVAAQEHAQRQLSSSEANRSAARLEAATLHEHLAQVERDRREQSPHTEAERARESAAELLRSARESRDEAQRRRIEVSEQIRNADTDDERRVRLMEDLKAFEAQLQNADEVLVEARKAHQDAQQQLDAAHTVAATTRQREDVLRLQLYEEMEEFISEEERRSAQELEQTERYALELERIYNAKEARKKEAERATANMLDEMKVMLDGAGDDDPLDVFARQRIAAQEKARLVRDARKEATERTRAAREALLGAGKPE